MDLKTGLIFPALSTGYAGFLVTTLVSVSTMADFDEGIIFYLVSRVWPLSVLHTIQGLTSLRRSTIPFSDTILGYMELSSCLLPLYFTCYHLYHATDDDFQFVLGEKDDQAIIKKSLHVFCKRLCALAIIAVVVQYYFNFGVSFISPVPTLVLAGIESKSIRNFFIHGNELVREWLLVFEILRNPIYSMIVVMGLILYLHVVVVEPCFKLLIDSSSMMTNAYEQRRYIEISLGMLANAATAYYFRFQTDQLMFGFLNFALACLYYVPCFRIPTDLGITQFFVTSSIQCAVSLFGFFHLNTVLVLLIGCVLMVLKWKTESNQSAQPKRWVGEMRSNFSDRLICVVFACSLADLLLGHSPVFNATYTIKVHPFIILGSAVVVVWRKPLLKAVKIIYIIGVRNLKWWQGNSDK